MEYCLAGYITDIDAYIESFDSLIQGEDMCPHGGQQSIACKQLFLGQLEEIFHMTLGNNKDMERSDRVTIIDGKSEVILRYLRRIFYRTE